MSFAAQGLVGRVLRSQRRACLELESLQGQSKHSPKHVPLLLSPQVSIYQQKELGWIPTN